METWNFHGYAAPYLSLYAKEYLGKDYSFDEIGFGIFPQLMIELLNCRKIKADDFIRECKAYPYADLSTEEGQVHMEDTRVLWEKFKAIWDGADAGDTPPLDNKKVITTCPKCGGNITEANDAGNGFCLDCTRKELD